MKEDELRWNEFLGDENKERVIEKLKKRQLRSISKLGDRNPGDAAVFIPLVSIGGTPSVLFTVRSNQLSRHRNQVSFPGGLADTADHSPRSTALREAEEELGIKSCDVDIWGQLNSVPDTTHNITPVLGYVRNFSFKALKLNHAEVKSAFTLPLWHLADPLNSRYTQSRKLSFRSPVYLGGPRRIWGMTAFVLDMTLMLLLPQKLYKPISLSR